MRLSRQKTSIGIKTMFQLAAPERFPSFGYVIPKNQACIKQTTTRRENDKCRKVSQSVATCGCRIRKHQLVSKRCSNLLPLNVSLHLATGYRRTRLVTSKLPSQDEKTTSVARCRKVSQNA